MSSQPTEHWSLLLGVKTTAGTQVDNPDPGPS